jgi:rubrerythrin
MTFEEASKMFSIHLGMVFRELGKAIQPDYWICTNCGNLEFIERGVRCWKCGDGEMIYKGDVK